jgi:hypothetical protein
VCRTSSRQCTPSFSFTLLGGLRQRERLPSRFTGLIAAYRDQFRDLKTPMLSQSSRLVPSPRLHE